jgi:hypothetical protein
VDKRAFAVRYSTAFMVCALFLLLSGIALGAIDCAKCYSGYNGCATTDFCDEDDGVCAIGTPYDSKKFIRAYTYYCGAFHGQKYSCGLSGNTMNCYSTVQCYSEASCNGMFICSTSSGQTVDQCNGYVIVSGATCP